ncbi:MAG: SDR family oxidoreductase [Cyanobacteria bacterium P01_D01_bin.50]
MKFYQKHAIITGGSSGIGKATAILLANQGASITIIARDRDRLEKAKVEIEAARVSPEQQIICISASVTEQIQIEQAITQAVEEIGTPDILITSAGIAHPGYFDELSLEVFEETMKINYFGTLYAIKSVLPLMIEKQQGHIVIISSGAGLIGIYGYTPYSPSKFALRGLAESLRGEIQPQGINISIVYPPDTDTPQLAAENLTKPPETKLITGSAKTWSAEGVAKVILTGIKRKDFVITPGLEMKLLQVLHSLLAPILNWYFDGIVKKVGR